MSFGLVTNVPIPADRNASIARVKGDVAKVLSDIKTVIPQLPPYEWASGMIVGYLRAKGYSWEDAMTAMDVYLQVAGKPPSLPRHSFRMELVTCSVGCSSFLKTFLERNMRHFERTMVVTDPSDTQSQQLAESMGADLLISDRFYHAGRRFDRGSVYNRALKDLRYKDWVAFVDVDIVLPNAFRARLEDHGLSDDCFYGMSRIDIHGEDNRKAFLSGEPFKGEPHNGESDWGFGFFQLFCLKSRFLAGVDPVYPSHDDVNHSDFLFRRQFGTGHVFDDKTGIWHWDPQHQIKLPMSCHHLGADGGTTPSLTRHYQNPEYSPLPNL